MEGEGGRRVVSRRGSGRLGVEKGNLPDLGDLVGDEGVTEPDGRGRAGGRGRKVEGGGRGRKGR